MYIPKHYLVEDREKLIAFMREFSFATLITSKNNYPKATSIPFVIEHENTYVKLFSHVATANDHWGSGFGHFSRAACVRFPEIL